MLFVLLIQFSCSNIPDEVQKVISGAGKNRYELQKVITHYQETKEKKKLKAAYFLIKNMEDKYGDYYLDSAIYTSFFQKVDSLKRIEPCQSKIDRYIDELIIKGEYAKILYQNPVRRYDKYVITSGFLIENIEYAFKVWKEKPWAVHLSFDEFCEWLLPYRIGNEPLQPWRKYMFEKLNYTVDSLNNIADTKGACLKINNYLAENFLFSHKLGFLPVFGGIDSWNYKAGVCEHRYQLIALSLRSMGIPCSIDFTPQFPRKTDGHSWTVLLDSDGNTKSFNGGEKNIEFLYPNACPIGLDEKVTTVYRKTYAKNEDCLLNFEQVKNVPSTFRNYYIREVTYEYGGLRRGNITLELNDDYEKKYVYLFSFDYGTNVKAIAYSKIKKGKVTFKNIGRGGIYIAGYYNTEQITFCSKPFIFPDPVGGMKYLDPDTTKVENVTLTRKFNVKWTMIPFIEGMVGAVIEGADNPQFKNCRRIYEITDTINYFREISISIPEGFRYFRYKPTDSSDIRLAEINFFHKNKEGIKQQVIGIPYGNISDKGTCDDTLFTNAFDNNIQTSFNAPIGSWLAIDAGRPIKPTSFSILARNHLNIVVPGDNYELFYFNDGWHSLGIKTATEYFIEFGNVPKKALLVLSNRTRGKEERIFMYSNGEQIWW